VVASVAVPTVDETTPSNAYPERDMVDIENNEKGDVVNNREDT
jgi:hypothetical protein